MNKKQLLKRIVKSISYGAISGFLISTLILLRQLLAGTDFVFAFDMYVAIFSALLGLYFEVIRIITDWFFLSKISSIFRGFIAGITITSMLMLFYFGVPDIKDILFIYIIAGFWGALFDLFLTKFNK